MRFVGCLVEVSLLVALLRSNLSRRNVTCEIGDNRGASYNNSNERDSISLDMGTYTYRYVSQSANAAIYAVAGIFNVNADPDDTRNPFTRTYGQGW
jgi:hypothetical protein